MTKARLLVIEGTDCSGKETQSKLLVERLTKDGEQIQRLSFPMYDTPTGKIIGGPYLGKKHICDGFFPEGAANVDPKVASLYYAADRKNNIGMINELLERGINILLDRYVGSNMGHQGGKLKTKEERLAMYKWLEALEYGLMELPRPDSTMFLYMPYKDSIELKKNREEALDQHEASEEHLLNAEQAYLELAELYDYKLFDCVHDGRVKSIETIHGEIYKHVRQLMRK